MNKFMQHALELAKIRRGFCAPNPSVGCVVVKNNQIIAEGYHYACGHSHAEVDALKKIGAAAEGADLYVTLEPCCHWGRTPPCTQSIVEAKIKNVYYGYGDPNPKVSGQGAATLKQAGISCEKITAPEIDFFYQSYAYWTQHKKPFVTIKLAISLDGFIAGPNGKPVEITGQQAKLFTFENRLRSDAILTTINTITNDNPQLNIRFGNENIRKPVYLLDSRLRYRYTSKLTSTSEKLVIFHQKRVPKFKTDVLQANAMQTIAIRRNDFGLNLDDVLKAIGEAGVHDLWVEAGATCFANFCQSGLANRAYLYYSPKKLSSGVPAFEKALNLPPHKLQIAKLGDDSLTRFDFV